MSDLGQALWPFFLVVILTVTILLAGVVASLVIGRRRLVRAHQRFVHRLLHTRYEERRAVATEIHANLTHRMNLILHEVAETRRGSDGIPPEGRLRFIEDELRDFNEFARRFARKIHPTSLDSTGLRDALDTLAAELKRTRGLTVHLDCEATGLPKGRLGYSIFGVVQEALNNVVRHAGVTEAWVTVRREGDQVVTKIRDEGAGFVPVPPTETSADGIGLVTMREQAQLEGGTWAVDSQPGGGTTVTARLPASGGQDG